MPLIRSFLQAAPVLLRRLPMEAWVWSAGLLALALADPASEGVLNLCVWQHLGDSVGYSVPGLLGLEGCPGCGLGHAVAYLLDGRLDPALRTHLLAPFALIALAGRVVVLVREAAQVPPQAAAVS